MFNPQRKSKVSDIFMQEKIYQNHLSKMRHINETSAPKDQREKEEQEQQRYLNRLSSSKREVQDRIVSDIRKENKRLFKQLLKTDLRKEDNPEDDYLKNRKNHFNSYFSSKRELQRVRQSNHTMVCRMMNMSSEVPTLSQCKKDHKKNRQLSKNCRKLPSIFQHETEYKKKLSPSTRYDGVTSRGSKTQTKSSRFSAMKLSRAQNQHQIEAQIMRQQVSQELKKSKGTN